MDQPQKPKRFTINTQGFKQSIRKYWLLWALFILGLVLLRLWVQFPLPNCSDFSAQVMEAGDILQSQQSGASLEGVGPRPEMCETWPPFNYMALQGFSGLFCMMLAAFLAMRISDAEETQSDAEEVTLVGQIFRRGDFRPMPVDVLWDTGLSPRYGLMAVALSAGTLGAFGLLMLVVSLGAYASDILGEVVLSYAMTGLILVLSCFSFVKLNNAFPRSRAWPKGEVRPKTAMLDVKRRFALTTGNKLLLSVLLVGMTAVITKFGVGYVEAMEPVEGYPYVRQFALGAKMVLAFAASVIGFFLPILLFTGFRMVIAVPKTELDALGIDPEMPRS